MGLVLTTQRRQLGVLGWDLGAWPCGLHTDRLWLWAALGGVVALGGMPAASSHTLVIVHSQLDPVEAGSASSALCIRNQRNASFKPSSWLL